MPVYAASRRLEYQNDNQNTDQTGEEKTLKVKYGADTGLTADDVVLWDAKDVSIESTATRGGRAFEIKTGAEYELELPAAGTGYKWTFTPDSNVTKVSETATTYRFKITDAAEITITKVEDPDSEGPAPETGLIDKQFEGKVELVVGDKKVPASEAHIITSNDDVSKGKYNGMNVGDLYMAFKVPDGVTLNTTVGNNPVDFTAGGAAYVGVTPSAVTANGIVKVAAANVPAAVAAGNTSKIVVTANSATVKHPIKVVLPDGYTVRYGTGMTDTEMEHTGGTKKDIKLVFAGADDKVFKSVSMKYSITGLSGQTAPLTGTVDGNVAAGGIVTVAALMSATKDAEADVVVTITDIQGKTVTGKVDFEAVKDIITNSNANTTVIAKDAGHNKGATLDLDANKVDGFTLASNVKSALVTYELSGVTAVAGNDVAVTGIGVIDSGTLTLHKDAATAAGTGKASFTVDGDEAVVVKITGVTEITFDKTKFSGLSATGLDGQNSFTVAAADNITLVNEGGKWVNKGAVTLNITPGAAFTAGNKTATVTFLTGAEYTGAALTTTATATNTNPVTVSLLAKTLEVTDFANPATILIVGN